jgi:hypothetical protein
VFGLTQVDGARMQSTNVDHARNMAQIRLTRIVLLIGMLESEIDVVVEW